MSLEEMQLVGISNCLILIVECFSGTLKGLVHLGSDCYQSSFNRLDHSPPGGCRTCIKIGYSGISGVRVYPNVLRKGIDSSSKEGADKDDFREPVINLLEVI